MPRYLCSKWTSGRGGVRFWEDGDLCDWKKLLGGCEHDSMWTTGIYDQNLPWPLYHVFFSNHLLLLTHGLTVNRHMNAAILGNAANRYRHSKAWINDLFLSDAKRIERAKCQDSSQANHQRLMLHWKFLLLRGKIASQQNSGVLAALQRHGTLQHRWFLCALQHWSAQNSNKENAVHHQGTL